MNRDRTSKNKIFCSKWTHKGNITMHVFIVCPFILYFTHSYVAAPEQVKSAEIFGIHITPWFAVTFIK